MDLKVRPGRSAQALPERRSCMPPEAHGTCERRRRPRCRTQSRRARRRAGLRAAWSAWSAKIQLATSASPVQCTRRRFADEPSRNALAAPTGAAPDRSAALRRPRPPRRATPSRQASRRAPPAAPPPPRGTSGGCATAARGRRADRGRRPRSSRAAGRLSGSSAAYRARPPREALHESMTTSCAPPQRRCRRKVASSAAVASRGGEPAANARHGEESVALDRERRRPAASDATSAAQSVVFSRARRPDRQQQRWRPAAEEQRDANVLARAAFKVVVSFGADLREAARAEEMHAVVGERTLAARNVHERLQRQTAQRVAARRADAAPLERASRLRSAVGRSSRRAPRCAAWWSPLDSSSTSRSAPALSPREAMPFAFGVAESIGAVRDEPHARRCREPRCHQPEAEAVDVPAGDEHIGQRREADPRRHAADERGARCVVDLRQRLRTDEHDAPPGHGHSSSSRAAPHSSASGASFGGRARPSARWKLADSTSFGTDQHPRYARAHAPTRRSRRRAAPRSCSSSFS